MSEPLYVPCHGEEEIPTADKIVKLVTDNQHLVLKLFRTQPIDFDKKSIIKRLADQLPEYHVFDSGNSLDGPTWITVKKVVSQTVVESHAAEIVAAAHMFRELATELMTRLAYKLSVSLEGFATDRKFWVRLQITQSGRLDSEWSYFFHGYECCFTNKKTGQYMDVRLGFAGEFGVLDPYFFAKFIKSTAGMEDLGHILNDDFHDSLRMLEILGTHGDLKMVADTEQHRRGWIVPKKGRETESRYSGI